ncbi:zinc-ribbon domain containing protein [Chitinimonas sp. PSY-7]|uniref:zinc-ribbon domain containing protein n=1 Tax=Chitinimonas sp. PSY-7 TaxID=3459088 RepID=UPI00404028FB
MQSGKQKRTAIMARRKMRRDTITKAVLIDISGQPRPMATLPVNPAALAHFNSYDVPLFIGLGYYEDLCFVCRDCGVKQVWSAEQQQWLYETAKGYVYSTAVRCLTCQRERRLALSGR